MLADRRLIFGLAALLAASTALVTPAAAQTSDPATSANKAAAAKKTAEVDKAKPAKPASSKKTAAKPADGKSGSATFAATISAKTGSEPSNATALARTLAGALAATYSTQPALQAERAKLRATDEGVPQALAGWRPTVIVAGTAGYGDGYSAQSAGGVTLKQRTDRIIAQPQATITQPLYTGGKTSSTLHRAESQIMAERATLIAQEEQSFIDTVNAYVNVIQDQQLLALQVSNEQVLTEQLRATNDRFRVGEITRTDVAQAEAALAGATAQREVAEGNLQTARATFQRVVGYLPAG